MKRQYLHFTVFLLIFVSMPLMATAQTVDIPDSNLRAAIEVGLNKRAGAPITVDDMATLNQLTAKNANISDLTGLEFATNLAELDLSGEVVEDSWRNSNSISDLSPLAGLVNLKVLDVYSNSVSDISALVGLTNLEVLILADNSISDISALAGLTNLRGLGLWSNSISDISALAGLVNLRVLDLYGNSVSDISALSGLINLVALVLWNNSVSDISALAGLTNLTELDLDNNSISDISPLSGLINLTELYLSFNSISGISDLAGLTNLELLHLSGNGLSDMSVLVPVLSGLANLTALYLWENGISDISELSGLTNLEVLRLEGNSISDISALLGLINLTFVGLADNSISDISPLVANTGLKGEDLVNVRGNPLSYLSLHTHIPTLQSRGVTVGFDPRIPTALLKISGVVTEFDNVLIVEVRDGEGQPFAGVPVTFTVTSGDGTLSATSIVTNLNGRAESQLTLGADGNANTVRASIEGISHTVTFSDVVEEGVHIPEPNLRAAIEAALGKTAGIPITTDEMETLTRLEVTEAEIRVLTGLELATNLTVLDLSGNAITDISALSDLTDLTELYLFDNAVSDISPLVGLTNLTSLGLSGNAISDISVLSGLTDLALLGLGENAISDISTLSGLTNLALLGLGENAISDISALSGLTNLIVLGIAENLISDISPLSGLTNLTLLGLGENAISDISTLSGLTNLTELYLFDNAITDISALMDLTDLTELNLSSNAITDISVLSSLGNLTTLGLGGNSVSDISALSDLTGLTELWLWENSISDISALSGLTNLTGLGLSVNSIWDISALGALTNLTELYLFGNAITDISALSGLTNLTLLGLGENAISDISPLVENTGLGGEDVVDVRGNPLSSPSITTHIPALQSQGVTVQFDPQTPNFRLFVPVGVSLLHVPLKVTAVNGIPKPIESVGDLYDALGGANAVNLLTTYDPETQEWRSYLGDLSQGSLADAILMADKGIIVSMKTPVSSHLSGDALGTDGSSSITLHPGTNLVGVPLRDSRITHVSDLLNLEGIQGNVPEVIVLDNGAFKMVTQAGDDGDILLTGGGAFIMSAHEVATVAISGDGWTNASEPTAASPIALTGIQVDSATPVLAVTGSVVSSVGERGRMPHIRSGSGSGFRVTVKNLSTGRVATAVTDDKGVGYQLTFVDMETGRAAQIGDILEISAQSPDASIGVQPLRHVVTAADVKRSHIQLGELVTYEIPSATELLPNYPNPFNPETWIPYRLAADADVSVTIYDLGGGVVRRLHVGLMVAAAYERRDKAVYWDGRNEFGERVASGIYFYHLSAGDYSATRKMVISK